MLNTVMMFICAVALVVAAVMEVRLAIANSARRGGRGHEVDAQVRYLGGRAIKHGRTAALEEAVLARVTEILGSDVVSLRSEYDHCGVKCWTVTSNKGAFSYITSNEWVDPDYIVSSPAVAKVYRMRAGNGAESDDILLWQESIFIEGSDFERLKALYDATPPDARLAYLDDMERERKISQAKSEAARMAVVLNIPLSEVRARLAEAAAAQARTDEPKAEPTDEPTDEPKAEPTDEPEVEPKAEPEAEPTVEPEVEPKAEPTDEPKAEPMNEPKVEPTVEPKGEPKAEPEAEPEVEPEGKPKDEPKAEPEAEPKGEPKAKSKGKPKGEPKAKSKGKSKAGAKGGAARKASKARK